MILQNSVIISSCDFMGRGCSRCVIILPCFVAIRIVVVEITHDQRVENIMGGSPSWQVTSLPSFVAIGFMVVEI